MMNFPYSKQKWTAFALSALVLASAGQAYAAESTTTQPGQIQVAPANTQDTTAAQAIASKKLTLEGAVAVALQSNSDLKNVRLQAKTSDINATRMYTSARKIKSDMIESLQTAQSKYESKAQADSIRKLNGLEVKSAESKTKLGAQNVYYDYVHALADVELKKQSLKRAETQLKVAKAAFEVGTKAKTDILQTEMGVAGAQASLAVAENTLETARMKLNDFLGVDLNTKWEIDTTNKELAAPKLSLQEATDLALKQRVEITKAEEEVRLAEVTVDVIAQYSALSTYQGKIARNDVELAKIAVDDQKRVITMEVAEAYYNLNAAKLNAEFKAKAKESAAESYRLINLRFENGLATTLEVIQAEEELASQENEYAEALRGYNLAVVNFDTVLGN
ncbi:MAG TPA: TolC family protein [Candidatus Bathyarchaeia archaeon]|nr:TolC family protein [Candidatus Bathyarchaeia archaeon]